MNENDSIKLLRECDSGVKMGVSAINDVLCSVSSKRFRQCLTDCRNQHEILQDEIAKSLSAHCAETKDPPAAVRGMSLLKTNVKLAVNDSDATVADLMTDGCNMGVKSLHRYLNKYANADAESKGIAVRLIGLEDNLAKDIRVYL